MVAALIGIGALLVTNLVGVAFFVGRLAQKVESGQQIGRDNKKAIQRVHDMVIAHLQDPTKRWTNGDFEE